MMRYTYDIEGDSDGEPVDVILGDKILLGLVLFYVMLITFMLYV